MTDTKKLSELSCSEFTKQLKSESSVPSGGSAAALVGAIGAALASMTALFCTHHVQKKCEQESSAAAEKAQLNEAKLKKEQPKKTQSKETQLEGLEEELQEIKKTHEILEELHAKLLKLIDEDASAFLPMSKAYKMPHITNDQKAERQKAIQDALGTCVKPPMQVLQCCSKIISLLRPMLLSAGKLLLGDVACSASMLYGACIAAEFSVYANTRLMQNSSKAKEIESEVELLQKENAALVEQICKQAKSELLEEKNATENSTTEKSAASINEAQANTSPTSKIPADGILLGKPVAQKIDSETQKLAKELQSKHNIAPTLAILRIGDDKASASYEKSIIKRAQSCSIEINSYVLNEDAHEEELLEKITLLNKDKNIHGIMLFRPLPKSMNEQQICSAIAPEKDVDSATPASLAYTFSATGTGFVPCTAQSCMEILDYYGISLDGKNCVVLGRSLVVGKPVAALALQKNASVTVLHSHSKNAAQISQNADVIIAAIGKAESIDKDYLNSNKEQVILDVGINVNEQGKLVGDVSSNALKDLQKNYTPVPGGVGSVTTSVLLNHVALAAKNQER